jgi:beta-lactamase class A
MHASNATEQLMTAKQSPAPDPVSRLRYTRRTLLGAAVTTLLATGCAHRFASSQREFAAKIAAIQARLGGRIGVYVLDTGSQLELAFNEQQRFAMCSTFKALLAAAVLERVDAGTLSLDHMLAVRQEDMLSHAPVTSTRLATGRMSVRELCAATVEASDNPAANILLNVVDGPAGLTRFLRSTGDRVTRPDRMELELNTNLPGDPRDTTTPRAMVQTLEKLLLGDVLSLQSRMQLLAWLRGATTGLRRLRAGLPSDWQVGDKTGTGANGAANDVMIAWPPGRSAIVAAVYMSESQQPVSALEQGHAEIGRALAAHTAQ